MSLTEKAENQAGAIAQLNFITVPPKGKKKKKKATQPLVISSLNSGLPVVLAEATPSLPKSKSAPSSPVNEQKTRQSRGILKHLPRPTSPRFRRKERDHEGGGGGGGHSRRPKWLPFRHRKKSKSADEINGISPGPSPLEGSLEALDVTSSNSGSSVEPEATPVATLPGQISDREQARTMDAEIPMITVSHSEDCYEEHNGMEGRDHQLRKMSGSSHHSHCSTLHSGTSGVGSLLTPSGDEADPGSDLESPLSPMSGASSSFTDELEGTSDNDFIDKDCSAVTSPTSDTETLVTTPTTPREISPPPDICGQYKEKKKYKVGVVVCCTGVHSIFNLKMTIMLVAFTACGHLGICTPCVSH